MSSRTATDNSVRSRQLETFKWLDDPAWLAAIRCLWPRLNEAQQRWVAGVLSLQIGHGGDKRIAEVTGLHSDTVRRGRHELEDQLDDCAEPGHVRRRGAGRPPIEDRVPEIRDELAALLEDDTAGDPQSGRRFTRKSTRWLAAELERRTGHPVSKDTVARLLKKGGSR
jgi:hypothetical protein